MAEQNGKMTMDQILSSDETPPAVEPPDFAAEERMSPDERDAAQFEAEQAKAEAEPAKAEEAPPQDAPPTESASPAPAEADDLPAFMTPEYLEKHPKDPKHWSTLRKARKAAEEGWQAAEERAKAQAERMRALEAEVAAMKAGASVPAAQPTQAPDMVPAEGLSAEELAFNAKLDISEANAIARHGREKVDQAFTWFQQQQARNPGAVATMRAQLDPWSWVVSEMDRHSMMARIGDDPAAFEQKIREEERNRLLAEMAGERAKEAEASEAEARARAEQEIQSRIPSSLANIPNASPNASQNGAWTGPAPINQVLDSRLDKL